MGLVKRWREYARQYGTAGLVRHLLARVVRPLWEHASAELLVLEPPAPGVTARTALRVAILAPEAARASGQSTPEWEQRWSRGEVCYAGWVEQRFVHHSWVARNDTYLGEVHGWLRLGSGEAYVYDCFTDGSCRGLGIFPAVLSHMGQELFIAGVSRIWIAVEQENRSSLKAIQRAGFRPAGSVSYRRVGTRVTRQVNGVPFGE
jgi:GNAT superfamily N-acetyltransferase